MLVLAYICASGLAIAAPSELEPPISTSGEAYLRAVADEDVFTSVVYHDPGQDGPVIDVDAELVDPDRRTSAPPAAFSGGWTGADIITAAVCALIILAIVGLVAKYGGAIRVSLDKAPDPGHRQANPAVINRTPDIEKLLSDIGAIVAIKDRHRAMGLLLRLVLERSARANGLAVGRSQTARDVLRALPSKSPFFQTLKELVQQAEMVRFGGRPITETSFQAWLAAAAPIIETRPR